MNTEQLSIMQNRKGFIAALDQSGGSTPKALAAYGVPEGSYPKEEMFNVMHQMRSRVMTAPTFTSEKILAAILFEMTMDAKVEEKYTADYLWEEKKIVPFLKIDKGLMDEKDGVRLMKEIPGLDNLLTRAVDRHIFGTKERSVINKADEKGIEAIVKQQFEIARKVISFGLVPIIEPEVTISIPDKAEAEKILLTKLLDAMKTLKEEDKVILKLSLPSVPGFYDHLALDRHVVRIVALSGGYSLEEADNQLKKNKMMIASFSRALLQNLRAQQSDEQFDMELKLAIDQIYDASVNKE
ncbi:MAG: fructose bisphosphate aldolase [Bacilli bacterium]|jgi:fructose-bisphosphate aldolase class I|nr:fructose bisphosphate aldolase [Bacilli bacterium]